MTSRARAVTWRSGLAAALLALGLAGCASLDTLQREIIFRPTVEPWRGYSPSLLAHEPVWIPVGDAGERMRAWWVPAEANDAPERAPTLLYLHGARVNLTGSVYRIRGYRRMGFNVLAIDYRGFGESSPRLPSEASVYEDADAAWRWLETREPDPRRRLIYGHSLGGAVATELAARIGDRAGALVLESTFTSIRDMAARGLGALMPWGTLLTQHFEVRERLAQVRIPVLIVHGQDDGVVPVEMAQALYASANVPKRLLTVEGAGHRAVVRHLDGEFAQLLRTLACAPSTPGVTKAYC